MANHPHQPPYRKLNRSRNDRVIGGVCGGLAHYANIDPTLVRLLTVVLAVITGGAPIPVYLIALFVVPEQEVAPPPPRQQSVNGWTYDPYPQADQRGGAGAYESPYGNPTRPMQYGVPSQGSDPAVWGAAGAPWEQPPQQGTYNADGPDADKRS